ncbi:DsbA family protein [Gordonia phthalatica]|uniref:Thioredoxin-like fold domain-containing protein n=1 Tax=Gordonia phthalatica TaxID=1136941 RepID=A0A0N9N695_9ACTN|nr:thioredoxin domain-containing protein [Gordonia phthalatica]ALG86074.1 hypothetical protein ACH46_18175 [Gordonia phthalatica]
MSAANSRRPYLIVAAALVAAVAVILLALQLRDTAPDAAAPPESTVLNTNTGPAGDVPRRAADDPLILGDDAAPVTMVVFSELTCRYCVHFATQIQPKLVDEYVKTGRLRIEWRDAPASGPAARTTARAGRAAAEQGRFWQFTDAVVRADQRSPLTVDALTDLARTAGITDLERFRSDADGTAFDQQIDADLRLAQSLFIPPSPAFWIDGTPLLSGLPLRAFTDVINGKLKLHNAD